MNRIGFVFIFLILFLSQTGSLAQDLFDSTHTARFAQYLMRNGNYRLAAQEFERLAFLYPANQNFRLNLVEAYRLNGEEPIALKRLTSFFPQDSIYKTPDLARRYCWLLVRTGNLIDEPAFQQLNLESADKDFYRISSYLFHEDYQRAQQYSMDLETAGNYPLEVLKRIVLDANNLPLKKPGLALGMSAVVPGLGKVYAGEWKDGLFSFLFTTAAAFQAYRGFKKNGSSSVYGWVYAGLGTGFYLGNLYGSVKSVFKYNQSRKHEIYHRTEELFIHYLD